MSASRILLASLLLSASLMVAQQKPGAPVSQNSSASGPAISKDADYSSQAVVVEKQRTTYKFNDDGTGTKVEQLVVKIQSDAGVQQLGQLRLAYSSANQKINVDYVRVRRPDGSVVNATSADVQDMTAPVARIAPSYTDYREKHITVPALRVGDTLEYQSTTETFTPLAPKQFWMEHTFNDQLIVLDELLAVDVPKSRPVKLKTTPDFKDYKTTEQGDRKLYTWTFKNLQTRASRERADRDNNTSQRKPKPSELPPSVQLTTFADWDSFAKWYSGLEQERRAPSAEMSAKAVALTKDLKTDREKIQAIYDYVAKNYRYISLSFGVGRFQPHNASEVFTNEYGDCKDKHNLLASLLKPLGYQLNTVLIHSAHKLDEDVPSPSQFDHVIGNINLNGQTIWMDTTTEVAPMGMLVNTIRNKKALQIDANGKATIVRTPDAIPVDNFSTSRIEGEVSELGRLQGHASYAMRGDSELAMRSVLRRVPRESWTEMTQYILMQHGLTGTATNVKSSDLLDTTKALTFEYDFSAPNFLDWTAKQTKFALPLEHISIPDTDEDSADPIKLGGPSSLTSTVKIKLPKTITVTPPVPVKLTRDYAEYSSTSSLDKDTNTITAERKIVLKQSELDPKRSSDLASLGRVINSDAGQRARAENSADTENAKTPDTAKPAEIEDAAYNALQSRKYDMAITLYKRLTELDPKNTRAWSNLGIAYVTIGDTAKAIDCFKKVAEINPYDEFVYVRLGAAYETKQDYDQALTYYKKQTEINPLDANAHTAIGRVLIRQRKYADAVPELERASEISPDDALILQQLGEAYLRTKQVDKAMAAFDKALEKQPEPVVWNNVAYTLAEQNQRLDKALQYAESAVSSTETMLRNIRPEQADTMGVGVSATLVTYWDTLGWVYFQQGNLEKAEQYIRPAWEHAQHGEVGYHLGRILEQRGDKKKAIETYAKAAVALHPVPEARERLVALVGSDKEADKLINNYRAQLSTDRSFKLNWTDESKGNVLLTFGANGSIQNVQFPQGAIKRSSASDDLRQMKLNLGFPSPNSNGFVRKGIVNCTKVSGCQLVLVPADAEAITSEQFTKVE